MFEDIEDDEEYFKVAATYKILFKQPRLMSKKEERAHHNDGHAFGLFGFGINNA